MHLYVWGLHIVIQHNGRLSHLLRIKSIHNTTNCHYALGKVQLIFSMRKFLVRSSQGRRCQFDTTSTLTAVREHKCSLRFGDGAFDINTDHRWCQPCGSHLSCLLRHEHRRPSPKFPSDWCCWERKREQEKVKGWQTIKSLCSVYCYHLSIVALQLQAYAVRGNSVWVYGNLNYYIHLPEGHLKGCAEKASCGEHREVVLAL